MVNSDCQCHWIKKHVETEPIGLSFVETLPKSFQSRMQGQSWTQRDRIRVPTTHKLLFYSEIFGGLICSFSYSSNYLTAQLINQWIYKRKRKMEKKKVPMELVKHSSRYVCDYISREYQITKTLIKWQINPLKDSGWHC